MTLPTVISNNDKTTTRTHIANAQRIDGTLKFAAAGHTPWKQIILNTNKSVTAADQLLQHYHPTKTCLHCTARLTVHEVARGDFCAAADCMTKAAIAAARQKHIDTEKRLDTLAIDYVHEHFGSAFITSRVPSNQALLGNTDPARISRFKATLQKQFALLDANYNGAVVTADVTADVAATHRQSHADQSHADKTPQQTAQSAPISTAAAGDVEPPPRSTPPGNVDSLSCTTCNGHCCRFGEEHAFLTEGTLGEILQNNPTMNSASLYTLYLQQLPTESFTGSCVYHTASGCALPRKFRSATCNNYECDGRKLYSAHLAEQRTGGTAQPIVVVAIDSETVQNTAICNPDSV